MDIERMHKWEHQHDDLGVVGPRGRGRGGAGGMGLGGPASRRARRGPSRGGGMHRAARGNVRAAILALLAEQKATGGAPMHGYQMIQELSTRTGGAWRPSPGSVYPTLQLLEDEGLVVSDAPEGKRVFELTEAGQAEFERTQGSRAPWDQVSDGFGESRLQLKIAARDTFVQLVWAARHGTEEQRAEILTLLGDLRNRLSALVPEGSAEHGPGQARGRGRARHAGWPGARATEADADWDPTESGDFEV
jgi:DNA-binding PadR family transcriptional regulator